MGADPEHCCDLRKVEPLERALGGARRLDHRPAPRAVADARERRKLEWDDEHGLWKLNPLADWTEKDVWRRIAERDLPYNALHDQGYASIGCTHCTRAGRGPRGPLGRPRQDGVRPARAPDGSLADPLFGFGVGILVGTTGMGGGSLMTPLLILVFGIKPVVAVGTDLAYAAITKTVGGLAALPQGHRADEPRVLARRSAPARARCRRRDPAATGCAASTTSCCR